MLTNLLGRLSWPIVFLVIFVGFYLFPGIDYQHHLIGESGDIFAHAWQTEPFCTNYIRYNFYDTSLFAPAGINFAKGYTNAFTGTLACLLRPLGPVAMIHFIIMFNVSMIFVTSWLVAKKYIGNNWLRLGFVFLYAFSAFTLVRLKGHSNILATVWGAALVLVLFDGLSYRRLKDVWWRFGLLGIALTSAWQNIPNLFMLMVFFVARSLIFEYRYWKQFAWSLWWGMVTLLLVFLPFGLPIIGANWGSTLSTQKTQLVAFTSLFSFLRLHERHVFMHYPPYSWIDTPVDHEAVLGIDPGIWLMGLVGLIVHMFKRVFPPRSYLLIPLFGYIVVPFGMWLTWGGDRTIGYFTQIFQVLPFSLTRVPSRLSVVAVLLICLLAILWFERGVMLIIRSKRTQTILFAIVGIYALLTTTVLSRNLQVPVIAYPDLFPLEALSQMAQTPEGMVLNVPLYNDQKQNFMKLYHKKPLISGYVSYVLLMEIERPLLDNSPMIQNFDCQSPRYTLGYDTPGILDNKDAYPLLLQQYLVTRNISHVIINHDEIRTSPNCMFLEPLDLVLGSRADLFKQLFANDHFSIYQVVDKQTSNEVLYAGVDWGNFITVEEGMSLVRSQGTITVVAQDTRDVNFRIDFDPDSYQDDQIRVHAGAEDYYPDDNGRIQGYVAPLNGEVTITVHSSGCELNEHGIELCTPVIITDVDVWYANPGVD